jgi:uncharacterized protein YciI
MKNILTALSFVVITSSLVFAQDFESQYEMKTYYMVFLKKGPNRDKHDSLTVAKIQKEHLANIERLAQEGYINIAGPFMDDQDLRGIFIMNVESKEKAEELVNTDPAVKAGRLIYEIRPWYSAKGSCLQ